MPAQLLSTNEGGILNLALADGGQVLVFANGGNPNSNSNGQSVQNVAPSSLVSPNVSMRQWDLYAAQGFPTGTADRVSTANNNGADGNFLDLVTVNFDTAAVGGGSRAMRFCLPATATGVQVAVPLSRGAGAQNVVLEILNVAGAVLASQVVALQAALTTATLTLSGLVGPLELVVRVVTNDTGAGSTAQAVCNVGNVTATPTGATTGLFASPFTRLEVIPALMQNCGYCDFVNGVAFRTNEFASFVFDTDAPNIAFEFFDTMAGSGVVAGNDQIVVWVNGKPFASVSGAAPAGSAATNFLNVVELSLASLGSGTKRVEIVNGSQQQGTATVAALAYNPVGTFLRAVYVPATYVARVLPQIPETRRIVFDCDSLFNGTTNTNATLNACITELRYGGNFEGSVASIGYGGKTLAEEANSPSALKDTIQRLQAFTPTDIVCNLGVNDTESLGTYNTLLTNYLNAIHAAIPAATVWFMTAAVNWPAPLRAQQISTLQAVANADAGTPAGYWLVPLDGQQAWQAAFAPTVGHPNVLGVGQQVQFFRTAFAGPQPWQFPGCVLSYDAQDAIVTTGHISALPDRSLSGNNAAASAVATKAGDANWTAGYGAQQVVQNILVSSANVAGLTNGSDPLFTVLASFQPADTTSLKEAWTIGGGAANSGVSLALSTPTNGDLGVVNGDGSGKLLGPAYTAAPSLVALTKFQTGAFNAAIRFRINGVNTPATGANAATMSWVAAPLVWGADGGSTPGLAMPNGKPFIAIFTIALPDGWIDRLLGTKALQYGLANYGGYNG